MRLYLGGISVPRFERRREPFVLRGKIEQLTPDFRVDVEFGVSPQASRVSAAFLRISHPSDVEDQAGYKARLYNRPKNNDNFEPPVCNRQKLEDCPASAPHKRFIWRRHPGG
jgi:hypothetical protein